MLGIHAREWISPATATYFIKELIERSHEIDSILNFYDVFILPVANPDG
jgi:carboxypeptidase A2